MPRPIRKNYKPIDLDEADDRNHDPASRVVSNFYRRDPREVAFANEYFKNGGNSTQAVLKMGLTKKQHSARVIGCTLLANPNVQHRLDFLRRKSLKETEVDAMWVVRKLIKLAGVDIGDVLVFDEKGNVIPRPELLEDNDYSYAIQEITEKGKIKLHDKTKALEKLYTHFLGLNNVSATMNGDNLAAGIQINITGGLPNKPRVKAKA